MAKELVHTRLRGSSMAADAESVLDSPRRCSKYAGSCGRGRWVAYKDTLQVNCSCADLSVCALPSLHRVQWTEFAPVTLL